MCHKKLGAVILAFGFVIPVVGIYGQEITPIADINVVTETGDPAFAGLQTMDKYTIEGIALNDAGIFNSEGDSSFILFVQDDTGGIQVYSGAWYGGGLANYPEVKQGDRVRATGLTGHFGGKTNINERHNPDQKFEITVLESGLSVTPISVFDLEAANQFDPTRATGGEYYQGRLVTLKSVRIVDGVWENGGMLSVADNRGKTFAVELRFNTGIGDSPQPEGTLDITGVFDQEDPEQPFTGTYLLWPRSIDDFESVASSVIGWDELK